MRRRAGRRPIGKRPMTGAERFRRWYAKHRKPNNADRIALLESRVTRLERRLAAISSVNRRP